MAEKESFKYVIVGGGLAGASAVQGIRELDEKGPILMIAAEIHLPYDRPPLSKKLWFGAMKVNEIFIHNRGYYDNHGVTLELDTRVVSLDLICKTLTDDKGREYLFEKLLLATGGTPRRLAIPGGTLEGISYFRTLDDFQKLRREAREGKSAVVIGGGFIGSELAAALTINQVSVTMIYPEEFLCSRVFPAGLGGALQNYYIKKGVRILKGDKPAEISKTGEKFLVRTEKGEKIESDLLVAGVGISPNVEFALVGGLDVENGIAVNEFLQTSDQHIYAAGDIAFFPYKSLELRTRIEHWDHALNQGKQAGRNMAGAMEPYDYQPYFFSDLFEFGYEATGEVDSRLETFADWQEENRTGVIFYLKEKKIRGVMMCNVWEKVETARELIRKGATVEPGELKGLIR